MGRTRYDPSMCSSNHKLHYGSGFPVFRGDVRQDGYGLGGMLSGLFRHIVPVLKPIAKSFAKSALKTGGRVVSDVISGRQPNIGEAVRKRVAETIDDAVTTKIPKRSGSTNKRVRQKQRRRKSDILD